MAGFTQAANGPAHPGVSKVQVTVLDKHGAILEQGEALRAEGDWWECVPGQMGQAITAITAAAWDLAGNVTKFDL